MKSVSFLIFVLIISVLSFEKTSLAKTNKKKLRVGIVLRLEDKYNHSVASLVKGIEFAKFEFQKNNPNVDIEYRRYPHSESIESVVKATEIAIRDKTPAIIGGELSEEALALGEQLSPHKILLMTPTSSNPSVTLGRPYVFRGCFSDDQVAGKLAEYVFQQIKPNSIGILHNVSSPYTDYNAKKFLETYNSISGIKSLSSIEVAKIVKDTTDFSSIIQKFIDKKISHVIMLNHQADLLRFNTQAVKRKYFPVYIGSDGWGSNENIFDNLVRSAKNGAHFVGLRYSYWYQESKSKKARIFRREFKLKYNEEPDAWSAIAYDSTIVLLTAMNRSKNPNNGDEIRLEMKKTNASTLVTSDLFRFEADNSPKKDMYIYRVDKTGINFEARLK